MPKDNLLLASLSSDNRESLMVCCTPVELPLKTLLYVAQEIPRYAYFMTSGLASVIVATASGQAAEVGFISSEGIVGGMHLLGPASLPTDCIIQLEGSALRISLSDLKAAFNSSDEIRERILEMAQEQALSMSQISACNRLHEAEERLARWLLMAQDRTEVDVLRFTQEFLAEMLGSQRTTVTVIAGALQRSGLIEYSRGHVRILNREELESAACDCYQVCRNLQANLYRRALRPNQIDTTV
jgi:CRP-like cAMP-binding protein